MATAEELSDPQVPIVQACATLGISRATLYRRTGRPTTPSFRPRPPSARKLSDAETEAIVHTLNGEEFVDQPPTPPVSEELSD